MSYQMGPCIGELDFTYMSLDDFEVAIWMEFPRKALFIYVLIIHYFLMMREETCIVPIRLSFKYKKKRISVLQLKKNGKLRELVEIGVYLGDNIVGKSTLKQQRILLAICHNPSQ